MSDVFQTGNGVPANFNDGTVEVTVAGSNKGRKQINAGETLGQFLNRMAATYGVRTFSAYADGRKLDTSNVNVSAVGVQKLELIMKDARGWAFAHTRLRHLFTTTTTT
jgi:hypothetical protein